MNALLHQQFNTMTPLPVILLRRCTDQQQIIRSLRKTKPELLLENLHDRSPIHHRPIPSITTSQLLLRRPQNYHPLPPPNLLFQHPHLLRRNGMSPHRSIHRWRNKDILLPPIDHSRGIPRPQHTRQQIIAYAVDHLRERVATQRRKKENMRPPPQLNMQDLIPAHPRFLPLVRIEIYAVDVPYLLNMPHIWYLGRLTLEEFLGGGGEDDADGDIRVCGEGASDVAYFYGGYRAGGSEKDVVLVIVRKIGRAEEGGGVEGGGIGHIASWAGWSW
jgi:hypothetical protein